MVIELTCQRLAERVLTIKGRLTGTPMEIRSLVYPTCNFELSAADPRLQGSAAAIYKPDAPVCDLKGDGPCSVEGRELKEGDRVRIINGGEVLWNR